MVGLARATAVLLACLCITASAHSEDVRQGTQGGAGTTGAEPLRVIVDVDPSGLVDLGMDLDDDLALLALLGSPAHEVELLGVTVTFGNTFRASALQNARSVLHIAGRPDVNVYAGADWWFAAAARWVDGDVGSGAGSDASDDAPGSETEARDGLTPAAAFIVDTVLAHPAGTVTLVALGPLTNVRVPVCRG